MASSSSEEKSALLQSKSDHHDNIQHQKQYGANSSASNPINSSMDDRKEADIRGHHHEHFHAETYKRRWWLLGVFSITALAQSTIWNTWSPITDSVLIAFDWTNSFVTLFPALANLGYAIFAFPLMYLVETHDLRYGMVVAASLLALSTACWNIALATHQDWLMVVGSVFNGVTACITMAAPPLLSALWFPTSERTTATAIGANGGYIGTGLAFITSPFISGSNVTADEVKHRSSLPNEFIDNLRAGISNVVYYDTGIATLCFILVLIYFPAKPPKPPSKSQTKEREDFWHGIKHLATNPQFWILNIAYNLPNGAFNSWIPLVSVSFRDLNVDEATAGWIGFSSICGSCVSSVLMSMVADHFKRRTKLFLKIMMAISIILFIILVCIQEKYFTLPQHAVVPVLYVLCIAVSLSINGVIPLYYELGVESAYPVHEGLSCSFITVINNISGMIYFLLFQIPILSADTQWMTWFCLCSCVVSLPLLVILKEHFYRLDVEMSDSDDEDDDEIDGSSSSQPIEA